ncbi:PLASMODESMATA CALLOSE-BINDING PROTEIN 2, partial [Zea mays]
DDTADHSPVQSPHRALPIARTHTLSLPPFTVQSRELKSSCSHGGSPASPPPAVRVHSLSRCGVLRVQAGHVRPDDAVGHRLRLQQGGRLRLHHQGRAVLRQRQQGGRLLLHLQQLLPEPQRHGRHLRLQRRRHPHRHRPQLRDLQ